MEKQKPVVAYYYDEESGNYCYTVNHPWRPHRSKLVHNLVTGYNLESEMIVHRPRSRTFEEITEFHADGKSLGLLFTQQGTVLSFRKGARTWFMVPSRFLAPCPPQQKQQCAGPRDMPAAALLSCTQTISTS